MAPDAPRRSAATFRSSRGGLRRARVLVVADLDLRTQLRGILGSARATQVDAGDALVALELAVGQAPDAIVIGPRLPHTSASELCAYFRELRATRDVPIYALVADDVGADSMLEAGADDTLQVPPRGPPMLARLGNLVACARAEREAARLQRAVGWSSLAGPADVDRVTGVVVFSHLRVLATDCAEDGLAGLFHDLSTVMERQRGIFGHFGATVRSVAGDGIVALFEGGRAAAQATRAALSVRKAAFGWDDIGSWSPVPVAIGISGGPVLRGLLGSEQAVFGPTVERALRLCGTAEPLEVLAEAAVLASVGADIVRFDRRMLPVRGGAGRVEAWAIATGPR